MVNIDIVVPRTSPVTVEEGIKAAQSKERLLRSPCPSSKKTWRSKRVTVEEWPEILVVNVKRFQKGALGQRWTKECRSIGFQPAMAQGGESYTLQAAVCHWGNSCHRGHYVCYQRRGAHWYKCDDAAVVRCEFATVLRDQAYSLYYLKS